MHAIPGPAQFRLSPQGALSNGYRVWGVRVTLGYEGNESSEGARRPTWSAAHGSRCLSSARSRHHLLRFRRSLFVLFGTRLDRFVGALSAAKVSF